MPLLDLTDREDVSFDALPAGKYRCSVFEVDERETDNPEGKLPVGTKYLNIHWRVEEDEPRRDPNTGTDINVFNRRVFSRLFFPPEGHPVDKAKRMNGIIYRTLQALGYSDEDLSSGSFNLEPDNLLERQAWVTVNRYEYPPNSGDFRNEVKGVKALSEAEVASSGIL